MESKGELRGSNKHDYMGGVCDAFCTSIAAFRYDTANCEGGLRIDTFQAARESLPEQTTQSRLSSKQLIQLFTCMNDRTLHTAMAAYDTALSRNTWLLDSGCNTYICNDVSWFTDLERFEMTVNTADNATSLQISGGGTVMLQLVDDDGNAFCLALHKVAFAPGARTNLLSISKIGKSGLKGNWDGNNITITSEGFKIGTAMESKGLYHVQLRDIPDGLLSDIPIAAVVDFNEPV